MKDLRIFMQWGHELQDIILVDNATHWFGFQVNNGIPMVPFIDMKDDREMIHLTHYLKQIAHVPDVRPKLAEKFMLAKLRKHEVLEKIDGVLEQGVEEVDDDFFLLDDKSYKPKETRAECSLEEIWTEGVGIANISTLKRWIPKTRPSNLPTFNIIFESSFENIMDLPDSEEYEIIETIEIEEY